MNPLTWEATEWDRVSDTATLVGICGGCGRHFKAHVSMTERIEFRHKECGAVNVIEHSGFADIGSHGWVPA